ncbi:MAG: GNAT family N-acetyltransferase [Pseudooceanicola sp.]
MKPSIHRITQNNIHLLDRIAADVFDDVIQNDHLVAMTETGTHVLLVALDEGCVVGQCLGMVHHGPDRAPMLYIDNLGVTPSHRRRGIGGALVQTMIQAGRDAGCTTGWLGSDPQSDTAEPFYRALGFSMQAAMFAEFDLD